MYLGPVPTEEPSQSYQQLQQGELQLDQVLGDHTEEMREEDQEREAAALEQSGELADSLGGLHDLPAMPRLVNQGGIGFSTMETEEGFGDESDYDSDEDNFEPEENGEELFHEVGSFLDISFDILLRKSWMQPSMASRRRPSGPGPRRRRMQRWCWTWTVTRTRLHQPNRLANLGIFDKQARQNTD